MANAIEELFRAPVLRRQLARKAHAIVRELSWAHQEAQFFAAIDELAGQRRGSVAGAPAQYEGGRGEPCEAPAERRVVRTTGM